MSDGQSGLHDLPEIHEHALLQGQIHLHQFHSDCVGLVLLGAHVRPARELRGWHRYQPIRHLPDLVHDVSLHHPVPPEPGHGVRFHLPLLLQPEPGEAFTAEAIPGGAHPDRPVLHADLSLFVVPAPEKLGAPGNRHKNGTPVQCRDFECGFR